MNLFHKAEKSHFWFGILLEYTLRASGETSTREMFS